MVLVTRLKIIAFVKKKQNLLLLYSCTINLKLVLTLSDDESLNRTQGGKKFYPLHGCNFTSYPPIQKIRLLISSKADIRNDDLFR